MGHLNTAAALPMHVPTLGSAAAVTGQSPGWQWQSDAGTRRQVSRTKSYVPREHMYRLILIFIYLYRVFPSNKQKQNWKIDTSLVVIAAQNLFFSLYKLGVNFLWIREILKMYISPSFSNRKKVQYYRFCIFKGVSKLDLLHSTGHKSLKNGSKSNNLGSLIKFRKFLAR